MAWDHSYRRLNEGEKIQSSDEVLCETALGWQPAGITVGKKAPSPAYTSHRIYRRKKDSDNARSSQIQAT